MDSNQMTASTWQLRRAFISTRAILAKVQPNQLHSPTPCTLWDVGTLIDHFIGSAKWGVIAVSSGEDIPSNEPGHDYLTTYDAIIDIALVAFNAPGALDKAMKLPKGEVTGVDVLEIVTRDQFVHGWDLARAIGHSTELDPDLAEELLVQAIAGVSDEIRGTDEGAIFGPIVEPPPRASLADRLAAYLGRSM
jgi:uncharacterized protein (TIGR03086 family)